MRLVCLLGLMALWVSPARGQVAGSCATGTAQRFLENPFLRAAVFNTGGLFFGGSTTSGDGYLIPKQDGTSPVFAAGLWLAGHVDGVDRVAAARYGSWDFWPGPLEDADEPPTDCSAYDRIFVVSREDIRRYYETGELANDLRDWPHQLGAPVLDGDGDSTNYNLEGGDQPDLIGDMAAWWVMNDAGNEHGASGPTGPLGVEVRAHAFVYGDLGQALSPALSQTMFIRYELHNRGALPITEMYATLFADPDLGNAGDDYIGSDTLRHMGFVYNDDNVDAGYGEAPPAWGMQVLIGPVVGTDTLGMTSASTFIGGGPDGTQDPGTGEQYYNYMRGLWGNGTPYYMYGSGFYQPEYTDEITPFMYPGDPVTESFYSEVNVDGNGTDSPQGDRRITISTGPFEIQPGASQTILYAFPYARGTSNLNSVARLQAVGAVLRGAAQAGAFQTGVPVEDSRRRQTLELALSRVHPNPSSRPPEVTLTLPTEAHVRATVYDALGRQLEVVVDGELPEGETELAIPDGLAPGTYLLRVEVTPGAVETLTFTVAR